MKARLYAEAGVREYWIADPNDRTLRIYALDGGRYAPVPPNLDGLRSRMLPGLVVDVPALFVDVA